MRLGIYAGTFGAALAAWAALDSGLALEIAAIRSTVIFLALSTAGYLADLVVVTAPPVLEEPALAPAEDDEDGDEETENDEDDGAGTPTSIAAAREERPTVAPERQAA